jgi:hypothetical protein
MEMCSSGHKEIVHDSQNCPLCEALEKIETLENDISDLRDMVSDLEGQLKEK